MLGLDQAVETYRKAVEKEKAKQLMLRDAQRRRKTYGWIGTEDTITDNVVVTAAATNAAGIVESGVKAARESNADATWFRSWAERDLPEVLVQGQYRALKLFNEEEEKKQKTWSARIKKVFWYVLGIVASAIVSYYVGYYVALAGFRI